MRNINEITGIETTMSRAEILALHRETLQNHGNGMALLESIRDETGVNAAGLKAAAEERKEQVEHLDVETGLTSEINTSRTMVSLSDTIRSLVMVLARHPYGFKGDGTRGENGILRKGLEPFELEENEAAEKWAEGAKLGREWATTGRLSTDKEV